MVTTNREWTESCNDGADRAMSIGTFGSLELANRAGEVYVEQRLEPFVLRKEEGYFVLRDTEKKKMDDGTMMWTVYGLHGRSTVMILKEVVRKDLWSIEDMPLALYASRNHDDKCSCCNTTRKTEDPKKAKDED